MNLRIVGIVVLAALLAAVPLVASEYWVALLTQILVFGLLALSADLLLGHAGLFSLCHAAFFAVSAYTVAILQTRHGVTTIPASLAGLCVGTLLAVVFAASVRTRGVYFILITLAFGYIIWGVAYRWASFTGGDNGVTNVPPPQFAGYVVDTKIEYYYFVLAVLVVCLAVYWVLTRSPFGLALRGIKSSESRMRSLGYRVGAHLYVAFVISGFYASLAGVLYIYYNRFVNPNAANFPISVEAILMAIVGGTGTILGPFIGSGIVLGIRNSGIHYSTAVLGVVFIATVLWAPNGIIGLIKGGLAHLKRIFANDNANNRGEGA
ncbi:MAG: branched-chain amino acid ABC transporter permease [Xanthobacteraceae bacterium]|nr:branched-chain amino acid ABC transporter permease [Xanthobacteraceae bacterium]QYK46220.1 MAG: branched-chain amino acid ABC transporter permease [Xanthobacteraceae bacterium]